MSVPVRLRSTCDACSVAKVKCDKKRPVCDRCRVNSFACSYSPSRRHGKQSWAKRVAEQQYQNSAILTSPTTSTTPPLLTSSFQTLSSLRDATANDSLGLTSIPLASTPATRQPGQRDESMDVDGADEQDADYSALTSFDALGDGFDFLSQLTGVDSGVDLQSGSETSDTQAYGKGPNSGGHYITPITEPAQPTLHDCEAKALKTLHSLHYCTIIHTDLPGVSKQSLKSSNNTPPLDKVLYFNRLAIGTLKELLECRCAQQPHLALLCTTIVSKALFWYRLAVSPQYQSLYGMNQVPASPSSSSATNFPFFADSMPCRTTERAVKSTPIQIGVFNLEEEDQRVLMRSVLLREVRKLESVVCEMKTMAGGYPRDDEGDDEQHTPNWYEAVGEKLKTEVRDVLNRTKEFGVGGHRPGNA